jgi:uncharacterized protein DUF6011
VDETRCVKCGRPLRDPASIARGMGPECAGIHGVRRIRYCSGVQSQRSSPSAAAYHSTVGGPTLFTLLDQDEPIGEQSVVEEVAAHRSELTKNLIQFPTYLVDLVLCAPANGAIAKHIKSFSKKKKLAGSSHPGRILQEIRRMCIDLRLTFFPGMSTPHGKQIACIPCGEADWKFDNSERMMSRQELEAYLSRYGMIRSAST